MSDSTSGKITFGIVTDTQFADADPKPPNYFRASAAKLGKCIADFNSKNLDFIINLGDTIDHKLSSFDPILEEFKAAKAPVHHLLGNHDFDVEPEERLLVPALMDIPGPPYYRSFSVADWRFVFLDGNELSLVAYPPDSEAHIRSQAYFDEFAKAGPTNAERYNGAVGDQQLDWLETELEQALAASQKVLIFNHFPTLPISTHSLWDAEKLADMLGRHPCVRAHVNGHFHRGSYVRRNGVHYLTLKAMLETPDTVTYSVAELENNQLTIRGMGNQPDYILDLSSTGN